MIQENASQISLGIEALLILADPVDATIPTWHIIEACCLESSQVDACFTTFSIARIVETSERAK